MSLPVTVSPLCLANLDRLNDGRLGAALADAVARALADLKAAPSDHRQRQVVVSLKFSTVPSEPDKVAVWARVEWKPPVDKALTQVGEATFNAGRPEFLFNTASQNHGQTTFADLPAGENGEGPF